MRLILARHGETEGNREYRVIGRMDMPLNPNGWKQAEKMGQALGHESIEAIYSSPQKRALQTAQAITKICPVEITTLEGLRELDVGELDGIYSPNMKTQYPDFFQQWTADAAGTRLPGGETLPELQKRMWASIQLIINKNHLQSVVVVSHFFGLLSLFCKVLDISLSDFRRLGLSVASLSVLDFTNGKVLLESFNHIYHLCDGSNQDDGFPPLKTRKQPSN